MSTTTSIEKVPANIPHLEPNGSNWAIFTLHFRDAMKVTHHWAYFTGLKAQPMLQVYKPGELGRMRAGGSVDTDLSGRACGTITVMYYL